MKGMYNDSTVILNSNVMPRAETLDGEMEYLFGVGMSAMKEIQELKRRVRRFADEDAQIVDNRMARWINDNFTMLN